MLKKLLKYEFLSVKRLLIPALCAVPALGLVATLLGLLLNRLDSALLKIPIGMLYGFCMLGMAAAACLVAVLLIVRYYRSLFTDEGYLTMVLPVSIKLQVFAKLLSAFVWTLGYGIVLFFALFFSIATPIAAASGTSVFSLLSTVVGFIGDLFAVSTVDSALLTAELLLALITAILMQIIVFYISITLGAVVLGKHKILGAVLFYFVTNAVVSTVNSLLQYGIGSVLLSTGMNESLVSFHLYMVLQIVVNAAIAVGGFFFNHYLLDKKLNLE